LEIYNLNFDYIKKNQAMQPFPNNFKTLNQRTVTKETQLWLFNSYISFLISNIDSVL